MIIEGFEHFSRRNTIGEVYTVSILGFIEHTRITWVVRELDGQEFSFIRFENSCQILCNYFLIIPFFYHRSYEESLACLCCCETGRLKLIPPFFWHSHLSSIKHL